MAMPGRRAVKLVADAGRPGMRAGPGRIPLGLREDRCGDLEQRWTKRAPQVLRDLPQLADQPAQFLLPSSATVYLLNASTWTMKLDGGDGARGGLLLGEGLGGDPRSRHHVPQGGVLGEVGGQPVLRARRHGLRTMTGSACSPAQEDARQVTSYASWSGVVAIWLRLSTDCAAASPGSPVKPMHRTLSSVPFTGCPSTHVHRVGVGVCVPRGGHERVRAGRDR